MRRLGLSQSSYRIAAHLPNHTTYRHPVLPSLLRVSQLYNSNTSSTTPNPGNGNNMTVEDVTKYLEKSPDAVIKLLDRLEPSTRRKLIVAGGAMEWFGSADVEKELVNADQDRDHHISPKEFNKWFKSALGRKGNEQQAEATPSATTASSPTLSVPMRTLLRVAFSAGMPFVGFGFLDNSLMLLAGDFIDSTVGFYFHCSVMASAAMGNVVSGAIGMQVHGVLDRLFQLIGFGMPRLSHDEMELRSVFLAGHIGGTCGIALGLTLGMLPLLFLPDPEEKKAKFLFSEID
eukprot:PhF_6_TR30568/c0_g1_i2/m.44919